MAGNARGFNLNLAVPMCNGNATHTLAVVRNAVAIEVLAEPLADVAGIGYAVGIAIRTGRTNRRKLAFIRDAVGAAVRARLIENVADVGYAV